MLFHIKKLYISYNQLIITFIYILYLLIDDFAAANFNFMLIFLPIHVQYDGN